MNKSEMVIYALIWISVQLVSSSNIGGTRQDISLSSEGGYGDILIAIDEAVPENPGIITNLQEQFTRASEFLLQATKNEMYFDSFTILVPSTWSYNSAWSAPTDESVTRARVIVAEANNNWGNVPYTLQPGQCGEEGDYIHLTPEYLTNIANQETTNPAKKLVRQFAHLKWGLFDEDIPITDNLSPYYYTRDSAVYPTLCVEDGFSGYFRNGDIEGGSCTLTVMGTVVSTCRFFPETAVANASIMYNEQFDSVVEFCSTDDGDAPSTIQHNRFAPNRQNRLCNAQSAWDVLNSLPDFAFNHSAYREGVTPYAPTFTIIQEPGTIAPPGVCPQDIVCLSLDVSGSMNSFGRITKMEVAVKKYIKYYLNPGSLVGVVSFSSSATQLAPMTEITSDSVRQSLSAVVPSTADGGTSIGSGLNECINMLRSYAEADNGNPVRIMLLGDGQQNTGLSVADVEADILQLGIIVDTIAYSFTADTVLSSLSQATGGYAFFTSDDNTQSLNTALIQTIQRQCDIDSIALLVSELSILTESSITKEVYIDGTIGLNTTIVISYTENIDVVVSTPTPNQEIMLQTDPLLKIIILVIVGQANGLITYTISKVGHSDPEYLVIAITSNPAPQVLPITIDARLSSTDISFESSTQLRAYIGIFQGLTPITGLTVQALIETGSSQETIMYNDFGLGMDSTPNDGIYSASFFSHQFTGDGYYSLSVAIFGEGFISPPDNTGSRKKRQADSSLGNVTRVVSGGLAVVANFPGTPINDLTPPQQIRDLQLVGAINNGTEIYTLQWTAPGDDLNIGTVSGYSSEVSTLPSLADAQSLPADAILTEMSSLLVDAGRLLEMQINADKISPTLFGLAASADIPTFYFRIRTFDDATPPNQAEWSNPVSASIIDPTIFDPPVKAVTIPAKTGSTTVMELSISVGILIFVALGFAVGFVAVYLYKSKPGKDKEPRSYDRHSLTEVRTIPTSAYAATSSHKYYSVDYQQPSSRHSALVRPEYPPQVAETTSQRYANRAYQVY